MMSVQCQVKPVEIFKVYVPVHLSIDVFQPLIKRAGGCTTYRADGIWYSPEGEQVAEGVQVLEVCITDEDDNVETCLELLIDAGEEYLRLNPDEKAMLATACRTSLYFTRDCADNQGD